VVIFAIPRAFEGAVAERQRNAVQSWLLSGYDVLLCGDDPGVAEYAAEMGADYLPGIARNEWGTPLLSDLFAQAQARLAARLCAYVNADIMLDASLGEAVALAAGRFERFLVVGRRYDVDLAGAFDFSGDPDLDGGAGWQARLRALCDPARLHGEFGLDYFGFRAPLWQDIPPLAIGRMRWDNWLLDAAWKAGAETVDATGMTLAVHQSHGYEHIPAEHGTPEWNAYPEIRRNLELAGECVIGTNSCRWAIDKGSIQERR
jgi:hypothetical protein